MEIFDDGKTRGSFLRLVGPRLSLAVVVVALALSGAVLGSGVTAETASNATANLPNDAESAEAARLQDRLSSAQYARRSWSTTAVGTA